MKKKILTISLAIISCVVLAILAEVFIFNCKSLTSAEKTIELSYDIETIEGETTTKINAHEQFVNKLVINYDTPKDINYSLAYVYTGLYDQEEIKEIPVDVFDDTFNYSITNIGQKVKDIIIRYPKNDYLSIKNIFIDNNFHFNYFRTIFITLVLLTIFFLFYFYKTGFKTEKIHIYFAVICTLLGSMFIVAQPVATFYSWDDQIHFTATIDWFGGTIKYSNGEYNLSDHNVLNSAGKNAVNSAEEKQQQINYLDAEVDHNFTKTNRLLPRIDKLSYLPMAVGYNLAKFINLPFTACFIIGKLFNLLLYVFLTAYAIKILRTGKALVAFLSLIPTNLFLASNYSYDPAVFAGLTIFIAHAVNLFVDKSSKLDFKTAIIMIMSIIYACFAKAIYAPFLLLTLLIPRNKFQNSKQSYLIKAGFIALMLTLIALPLFNGGATSDPRGGDTSISKQASLIISHPLDYATVFNDNAVEYFSTSLIGAGSTINFAYLGNIREVSNLYFILIIFLIFIFLTDNKNNSLDKKQRFLLLITTLSVIALIWTTIYLSYNPVGESSIGGVQGRYFLSLLFPLLLVFQPKNIQNKIDPKKYNLLTLAIPTIITIIAIYDLILSPFSF